MNIQLFNGDCLQEMNQITAGSVDMILTDLPFGCTDNSWDLIIPFDQLWQQFNRVTKKNAAVCLFGVEPFSSMLRMSNLKAYKYDWIWKKNAGGNFLNAKKQPIRRHENISVFYRQQPTYNPQWSYGKPYTAKQGNYNSTNYSIPKNDNVLTVSDGRRYPTTVLSFKVANTEKQTNVIHPNQKPVALLEYLIRTYTNEGDTVLDATMGSGSTAIAAINTNRNFIGIERDADYFQAATERIRQRQSQPTIFDK